MCVCVMCICAILLHDLATNKFQRLKKGKEREREEEAEVCAIAVSRVGSVFLANPLEPN